MKKALWFITNCLLVMCIFLSLPSCFSDDSSAEGNNGNNNGSGENGDEEDPKATFDYIDMPDGTVYITGGDYFGDDLTIPDKIDGKVVSGISQKAFSECLIESLTVPEGVKNIERNAFANCGRLKSISLPSSLEYIGDSAFSGCSVEILTIPGAVSIGQSAFSYCNKLKSVTLPDGLSSIGASAFNSCSSLETVRFPDSLTEIGSEVFRYCDSLKFNTYDNALYFGDESNPYFMLFRVADTEATSCEINSNTKVIYDCAFEYCNIEQINIPDGVIAIGYSAFYNYKIKSISVPNSVICIGDSAFNTDIENYSTYNGAKYIGNGTNPYLILLRLNDYEAEDCVIHSDTRFISSYAFSDSTELKRVTIPDSVVSIGCESFKKSGIESIVIGNGVKRIGYAAFKSCKQLSSVSMGNSVSYIDRYAFYDCERLKSLNLSSGLRTIKDYTFYCCKKLTTVTIPEGIVDIEQSAFEGCGRLVNINLPSTLTSLDYVAFRACNGAIIHIDEQNPKFKVVDDVLYSKDGKILVRYADAKLNEAFTVPNGVEVIADYAFDSCINLTSITLPNGLLGIGKSAFFSCIKLESIELPESIYYIGDCAFKECTSLGNISISENNNAYETIDGNLYTKGAYMLIQYALGKKDESFKFPSSVLQISNAAFCGSRYLESIVIPGRIDTIPNEAFSGCIELKDVTIDDGVQYIYDSAFYYCLDLETIKLPDSVISIGKSAFAHCRNMTSIEMSENINNIGELAFMSCERLESIELPASMDGSIGYEAFKGCRSLTVVIISDGITEIAPRLFSDCSELIKIVIPKSVTWIDVDAFDKCDKFARIFYMGTAEELNDVYGCLDGYFYTADNREILCFYYSETAPTERGNWWHYVDGAPKIW